jgi:hypothetical protein
MNRAGGVSHMVQRLPSKCEVLSLNPSTAKKKEKVSINNVVNTVRIVATELNAAVVPKLFPLTTGNT